MFASPKHNLFILITSYKVYCVIILCKRKIASTLLVAGRALVKMATFECELYKTNTLYRSPILTVIHVALVLVFFEYAIYFNIELCYKRRQQEIGYVNWFCDSYLIIIMIGTLHILVKNAQEPHFNINLLLCAMHI